MMKNIVYSLILLVAAAACKDVFEAPPKALLQVALENVDSTDVSIPDVSVYGVGMDDTLWIFEQQTSEFRLPLSTEQRTSFVLLLDSIADTLTIIHQNELIFQSAETGFYNEYKILDVEHTFNRIDDYEVIDSAVTKNWHENIQLYINSLPANSN